MTEYEVDAAFEKKYNWRTADRCCLNCKHGEPEYEGVATCSHPERAYEKNGEIYISRHNTSCHRVCDAWEMK